MATSPLGKPERKAVRRAFTPHPFRPRPFKAGNPLRTPLAARLLPRGQKRLFAIVAAEDGRGGGAEPAVEDGGVDRAEVGGEDQVAVGVECGEIGRLAVDTALDRVAEHEE